ncbi:MAG: chemotaxis protein CheD [Clostridiales bacterium]|jgi:chemotaxis protein CheD|nr:chemotaxis protein CheD [Clostridiales bacterium]
MDGNTIIVGMADLRAARRPVSLTTLGLGSCVGIALFDKLSGVIGMAHCMLPDSRQIQSGGNPAKFVDTAVVKLILEMARIGARKDLLRAKLAGGAQMFAGVGMNDIMRIGERNVEAAITTLSAYNIPIMARATGESFGRTITLSSLDYSLNVKTIEHGCRTI